MTAPPIEPCDCPEAQLLREILSGQIPAVDSPTWRALAAAIEARAAHLHADTLRQVSAAIHGDIDWRAHAAGPDHRELMRRRYPPDGDIDRWVRHGEHHPSRPSTTEAA